MQSYPTLDKLYESVFFLRQNPLIYIDRLYSQEVQYVK